MDALLFGLQLTAVGMGTVFLLLAALMVLLMALGRIDRPEPRRPLTGHLAKDALRPGTRKGDGTSAAATTAPPPPPAEATQATPTVRVHAHGLDDDLLSAIAVAVIKHSELRRRQAAPETRTVPPGSQLPHSRWVSLGRTTPPTSRS